MEGHFAGECPQSGVSGPGADPLYRHGRRHGHCFNCAGYGHVAKDCENDQFCHKCESRGHIGRECTAGGRGRVVSVRGRGGGYRGDRNGGGEHGWGKCYKCNRFGHFARDCSEEERCYKCNGTGHIARDCTEAGAGGDSGYSRSDRGGGGGGSGNCYSCGEAGHISRDCKKDRSSASNDDF